MNPTVLRGWVLAALPLVFLGAVLVAPVLRLLSESGVGGGSDSVWLPVQDAYLRARLWWSLAQAGFTCLATLLLGVPMAWVLARLEFVGRNGILRSLMLPFVVPTVVAALGVLALWGPDGVWARWGGPDMQGTPWLLLYGNVFFNLCLVVRAGVDALGAVSASRVAAARTLGATPWRVFWRVEWPAMVPWLASALCLVFLYCFSGFGLALILGGQDYATVEVEIYTLVAYELALAQASVLSLWAMALTALLAWGYARVGRRLATPARDDAIARRMPRSGYDWLAVTGVLAVWALFCAAPLVAIAWGAINSGANAWSVVWQDDTLQALGNTLAFSGLALVLATVLGVTHALAAQRLHWLRTLVFLPFIASPVIVSLGLLLLYPEQSGSFGMLVAAYALLAYPFVAKSLLARLDSLPSHYLEAARSLGASPWRCFWRITLPLMMPALRRGMAFAAATAVGEFAVSLFLSRPEWATLTTLIYAHLGKPGAYNLGAAQVLACVLMGLAMLVFMVIERPAQEERADA